MRMLILALTLACLTAQADVPDDGIVPPTTHGFHVVFSNHETDLAEATWQLLNVIDLAQSLQIAKNPQCYDETGQLSLIGGSHPSTSQVWVGMGLFAVLHYGIAKGIDSLVQSDSDYMVLQRVYQYGNLAFKGYTIENNARIGLDLNHSRSCQ